MGHKSSHKKDKGHKKDKSHKKDKHKRKKSRRSSSSSSSSDDDGIHDSLARDRAAVSTLRKILSYFPSEKKELREVLWSLDNGQSVNLAGIPDMLLRSMLTELFSHLQLRSSSKGDYLKPGGREPLLQLLGMVFSENITAVSRPAQLEQQPSTQGNEQSSSPAASPSKASTQVQDAAPTAGVAAAADAAGTSAPAAVEAAGQAGAAEQAAPEPHQAAAPEPDPEPEPEPVPAPRRMLGPAVPDARMLAAARAAAEMLAREEEQDAADFVGPAPPELMDEADAAPADEREAEVVRIMRLLRNLAPDAQPDAYDVIGVDPAAPTADIKKRYWRLSLMIHPDKCSHALANEAFQAVSKAARVLQDVGGRQELDAAREDAELKKLAEQVAAQQERERQWRVARGEEPAGPGPNAGPAQRETWMTELPPERRPGMGPPSQVSQTAFSRQGIRGRGDTSEWTDTPETRAARHMQAMLEGPSTGPLQLEGPAVSVVDAAMQQLLAQQRPKSLLEQHQERQAQALKGDKGKGRDKDKGRSSSKSKDKDKDRDRDRDRDKSSKDRKEKEKGKGEKRKAEEWASAHPWRPFDREKDMKQAGSAKSAAKLLNDGEALKGRFAGAGAQSSFL